MLLIKTLFFNVFVTTLVIVNNDWPLITKFWQTDLSSITTTLQDLYSGQGAIPRDPASMLRSYLIYLMTHPEKGLTKWVDIMKRTPIYAILSGFEPHDSVHLLIKQTLQQLDLLDKHLTRLWILRRL